VKLGFCLQLLEEIYYISPLLQLFAFGSCW